MARLGKKVISLPQEVEFDLTGSLIKLKGAKGELTFKLPPKIKVEKEGQELKVVARGNNKQTLANQGTVRQTIVNMIEGVKEGWQKVLEIKGTGYGAKMEGEDLILSLGFSHPVKITPPEGIKFEVMDKNLIKVFGIDKALVGREAARIRAARPPDAYKGKGIRYQGEEIKLKPGKAAKMGATGVGG